MLTGQEGQARDGILVDPHQPSSLADATAFGQMLQDGQDLVVRELGVEQRGALELGEPGLADFAVEQPMASFAEVIDDEDVPLAPSAVPVAVGILAAEASEVVCGHGGSRADP
jgi:hypothetical protein